MYVPLITQLKHYFKLGSTDNFKHYFKLGSTDNFVKVIPLIDSLWREFSNKTPWPLFRYIILNSTEHNKTANFMFS